MARPAFIPEDKWQLISQGARGSQITRSMHFGVFAIAVYDWFLCIKDEVTLLQTAGVPPAKAAYFLCRYWPLVAHPVILWIQGFDHSRDFCERHFRMPLYIVIVNFALAASILTIRIYAFSGYNRAVVITLGLCLAAVASYQIWVVATQIMLVSEGSGCYPVEPQTHFQFLSGYFFSPLIFDIIAMMFFLARAVSVFTFKPSLASDLTKRFLGEGFAYFIAISLINFANSAMSFQTATVAYSGVVVPLSMLLPNILACRLVINLRSAAEPKTSTSPSSGNVAPTFEFASSPVPRSPVSPNNAVKFSPFGLSEHRLRSTSVSRGGQSTTEIELSTRSDGLSTTLDGHDEPSG
ncbi:hypothetical protein BKA62DRAFT_475130 [Auriculariales sp. MPI-PUGE-AT-0066]|nr:hypothetical protein BKA62DRAFT_475130 [Auriculariales sp. MPI-PUGE-AT-0066]